ncbi:hypothetical protein ACFQGT_00290 [Natrialbaceae archaeon GCM10025810]
MSRADTPTLVETPTQRMVTGVRYATAEAIDPDQYVYRTGHERLYLAAVVRLTDATTREDHTYAAVYVTFDGDRLHAEPADGDVPHAIIGSVPEQPAITAVDCSRATKRQLRRVVADAHAEVPDDV